MALLKISEPLQEVNANEERPLVAGIDLGTTNSLIGIIEEEKIHLFADENGRELQKSVVAFDNDGNVIGVANNAFVDKNSIKISSIKRLMGKSFLEAKNLAKNLNLKLEEINDGANNHSSFYIVIGEKKYRPEEISALILIHLKNLAENSLTKEVKKAVITVPAYFDEGAKNATKAAATLAGLEISRLVSEPTAAALAYGLDNQSEGIYAVYDLGGGTFDISILKMKQGIFKVLGVSGDTALGGDDFDEIIQAMLKNKCDIFTARRLKEQLSYHDIVDFEEQQITRLDFEKLIAKKIDHSINLTAKLLQDLELQSTDLQGIILVGGSSRIPLIKEKLQNIFHPKQIFTNLDPDRVVAIGAAWQAYNLSGNSKNLLLDVIPLSLGIEMMGGIVDKVILRNSTIPAQVTKEFTTYADNQTGMKLHIVQGEREFANDCRSLARFEIKNIPPMKAGLARIAVSFKIDADGLLTVTAQEKITNQIQEILVKPSYGLNEQEVKTMLLDSMKNSAADMQNRLLTETKNELAQNIFVLEQDLETYKALLLQDEKENILKSLQDAKKALELSDRDLILAKQQELEKVSENFVLNKLNQALSGIVKKKVDDVA